MTSRLRSRVHRSSGSDQEGHWRRDGICLGGWRQYPSEKWGKFIVWWGNQWKFTHRFLEMLKMIWNERTVPSLFRCDGWLILAQKMISCAKKPAGSGAETWYFSSVFDTLARFKCTFNFPCVLTFSCVLWRFCGIFPSFLGIPKQRPVLFLDSGIMYGAMSTMSFYTSCGLISSNVRNIL